MKIMDWDKLFGFARAQESCFSEKQAAEAGFTRDALDRLCAQAQVGTQHVVDPIRRRADTPGVYQFVRWPGHARVDQGLVAVWLWSDADAVISHETALIAHGLGFHGHPDIIRITMPSRRNTPDVVYPKGVLPYYDDLALADMMWVGAVPVTTAARTVNDVASGGGAGGDPKALTGIIEAGLRKHLFSITDVLPAIRHLLQGET